MCPHTTYTQKNKQQKLKKKFITQQTNDKKNTGQKIQFFFLEIWHLLKLTEVS